MLWSKVYLKYYWLINRWQTFAELNFIYLETDILETAQEALSSIENMLCEMSKQIDDA
jgi:hypothetical protein